MWHDRCGSDAASTEVHMVIYTPPKAATHIPVIDLAPSFADSAQQRKDVAWEIHKACRDVGFFYVRNHGVAPPLITEEFASAEKFFGLPLDRRMAVHMNNSRNRAGYEGIGGQTLDTDAPPDLKESFYTNLDLPDDHPYAASGARGYGGNQWPDPSLLPGFREQQLAYHAAMRKLGFHLMRLIALSLDLPEDHFLPLYETPQCTLRIIKYPPHPQSSRFNQLGAGAHTDWGGITLLAQDDIGGLEVRNADGEWLAATPIPDTFVVNLGDMIARWTNGLYHSNMHRVLNNLGSGRDRYSVACFFSPDRNSTIACLPTCTDAENPPKFATCTAGEHLDEMFRRSYGAM
jgi:isopenicillin N synthase-like dioxygenase